MAPIDKHLPQPPEKALEEAKKKTDSEGKGSTAGNCWSDALLACLVECCPCSTCPAKCFNYKNEISQTCSQSRTLSQRAFGYPRTRARTATLFGLVSMQNYAKRVAVAPRASARALALASYSAGAGSMCCAYANVFPYPWPYQQTQRCLSNARQFKCAKQRGRRKWKGRQRSLSPVEARTTSQRAKFHLAFIHSCVAHSHSPR